MVTSDPNLLASVLSTVLTKHQPLFYYVKPTYQFAEIYIYILLLSSFTRNNNTEVKRYKFSTQNTCQTDFSLNLSEGIALHLMVVII